MTTVNCMSTILNSNSFLYVIGTDSKLQCFGGIPLANILPAEHVVITSFHPRLSDSDLRTKATNFATEGRPI